MPLVRSMKMRLRLSSRRHVGVRLRKLLDEVADLLDPLVVHVEHQRRRRACSSDETAGRRRLEDVVDLLALIEGVEERGERAEVERRRADAEQVIADAASARRGSCGCTCSAA